MKKNQFINLVPVCNIALKIEDILFAGPNIFFLCLFYVLLSQNTTSHMF